MMSSIPERGKMQMATQRKRRILVTNDDGIDAPGIALLAATARELGEVWVVAPASQCSAMSQRLTLHREMEIRESNTPRAESIGGSQIGTIDLGRG